MHGTSLSFSRQRNNYDDYDRLGYSWYASPWPSSGTSYAPTRSTSGTLVNTVASGNQTRRAPRYTRSSTTSVSQLLSDSCNNLFQKISTKVRGPSATIERTLINSKNNNATPHHPLSTSASTNSISSARSKFEDKYSSVLDKIYGRKKEEKSTDSCLSKSATTSNIYLNEKTNAIKNVREKTPYKSDNKKPQYPEPPYSYLDRDRDLIYRVRHKSNHSDLRPRRSTKPQRNSETSEKKYSTNLKIIDIPIDDTHENQDTSTEPFSERETKRKEIQSLIMKYSALDEFYNRKGGAEVASSASRSGIVENNSALVSISQKYHHQRNKAGVASGAVSTVRLFGCPLF